MISSTSRFGIPYGLKTLLKGISRATIKSNPSNINQFAVFYFKELIMYREGNTSLDIKDLVKQFYQIKNQKKTSVESKVPTRMEKSTDTEEDNVTGTGYSDKTTQFPSTYAELSAEQTEAVHDSSPKAATPKTTTPPSSPPPTAVSPEFAYVPKPKSPVFLSVAFPVEDVAKKSSGSGDKCAPFGSYGIAGEITVATAHKVRKADSENW
uniref:RIIa domain-containing protein n=1 Tax=Cebus imitator TaxID=2715852 RepID=A0A2K5S479_CEBIM